MMNNKDGLRPVLISFNGEKMNGYFHRFVYSLHGGNSETKVLVELENGKLRYYDPYFVQFMDREILKTEKAEIQSKDFKLFIDPLIKRFDTD